MTLAEAAARFYDIQQEMGSLEGGIVSALKEHGHGVPDSHGICGFVLDTKGRWLALEFNPRKAFPLEIFLCSVDPETSIGEVDRGQDAGQE